MLRRHELLAAAGVGGAEGWNPGLLTDPKCVALWNFGAGALTADSKGGNDLTNINGVTECTALKENLGCADFEKDSNQYLQIADADLDSGFPLKNGESNNKISVCFWIKPESATLYDKVVSKYDTGKASFFVGFISGGVLRLSIGYNSGASLQTVCTFGTGLTNGKLYHVGATYNGDTGDGRIRIWDDESGSLLNADATGNSGQVISITDAPFIIGNIAPATRPIDGQFAEMPVFNRDITPTEIDAIRDGIYV